MIFSFLPQVLESVSGASEASVLENVREEAIEVLSMELNRLAISLIVLCSSL